VQGRHRAAQPDCGSDRLGMSCHSMPIMKREGNKVSPRYRAKCGRYLNGGSVRQEASAAGSLSLGEVSPKERRNSGDVTALRADAPPLAVLRSSATLQHWPLQCHLTEPSYL
jgi:hypothetical protein